MGIFLGLGDAELLLARLGNGLSEGIFYNFLVEEYVHSGEACVVRGKAAVVERNGVHPLLRHIVLGKNAGYLSCAVVSEVYEDNCISLLYCGNLRSLLKRCAVASAVLNNRDWFNKLVCHAIVVRVLNRLRRVKALLSDSLYKKVVGYLYALPSLVSVHCIESSNYRGYLAGALGHLCLKLLYEALSALGVCIPAIHKAVNKDLIQSILLCQLQKGVEVLVGTVHASVREKSHKMKLLAALFHVVVNGLYLLILQESLLPAGLVYLYKVLIYHSAGTNVQVSYLRVAHLPLRQTYRLSAGQKLGMWIVRFKIIYIRLSRRVYCISFCEVSYSPPVQNHK